MTAPLEIYIFRNFHTIKEWKNITANKPDCTKQCNECKTLFNSMPDGHVHFTLNEPDNKTPCQMAELFYCDFCRSDVEKRISLINKENGYL